MVAPVRTIPITILGGSDLRPGSLPAAAAGQHALAAYKGASVRVGGRPLVELLVERLRGAGVLHPIQIAGPARIYRGLVPGVEVIDTDGGVADNVRAAVDAFLARHSEGPLAIATCDILPDPAELRAVLDELRRRGPSAVWFPLVRAPAERSAIGAFGWKPGYPLAPEPGAEPVDVLPSHLVIADPRALRLELLYRLLDVAYQTRNRPLSERRGRMLRAVLGGLLKQDLAHLLALRAPSLTWSVLAAGLRVARRLSARRLARGDVERLIGRIVLRASHRRIHPERGVRLPIVDALTLAEDVDTEEEARALESRRGLSTS